MVVAVAVNWDQNPSNEPNCSPIAAASSPVGSPPPSAERFCQNTEWLM